MCACSPGLTPTPDGGAAAAIHTGRWGAGLGRLPLPLPAVAACVCVRRCAVSVPKLSPPRAPPGNLKPVGIFDIIQCLSLAAVVACGGLVGERSQTGASQAGHGDWWRGRRASGARLVGVADWRGRRMSVRGRHTRSHARRRNRWTQRARARALSSPAATRVRGGITGPHGVPAFQI